MTAAPHRPPGTRVKLAAWALLLLGPVLAVLALELAANLYMDIRHSVPGRSYGIYKSHPKLGGILRENAYNSSKITNNLAFIRPDDIALAKPTGTKRVIAYGGSTTYCYNLALGEEWPAQLEKVAIDRGTKLQVLNAGDISWASGHINVRSREEVPILKPDYVIFYEGINEEDNIARLEGAGIDVAKALAEGKYGLFNRSIIQAQWLYRNSMIFKAYYQYLSKDIALWLSGNPAPNRSPLPDPVVREHFRRTVLAMISFWREQGAQPIFVIQASVDPGDPFLARITGYSRDLAEQARAAGAIVVDGQDVVRAHAAEAAELFYSTGIHWSARGSRLFSEHIFRTVELANGWR